VQRLKQRIADSTRTAPRKREMPALSDAARNRDEAPGHIP
jgi:hypothetical protein